MLIWLMCLVVGHKTVVRIGVGEKYDGFNPLSGNPEKQQDSTLVRLAYCRRCGEKVHDGEVHPMLSRDELAQAAAKQAKCTE